MSDTPISDSTPHNVADLGMLCRRLERELNAANVEIEEKRKDVVWLATEKAKLENYVTELENRLRALWDKYDGDRKHYMDRIKRLEEAHSWRLIETAPSNYTWILGYDEEHGETGMIIFERGDESEPHWTDGMREWEPTHWMPLPEPPKSKEDKL